MHTFGFFKAVIVIFSSVDIFSILVSIRRTVLFHNDACILFTSLIRRARELPPSPVPNVNAPVLAPFRSRMSRLFDFSGSNRRKFSSHRRSLSEASSLERPTTHQESLQGGIELPDSGSEVKVLEGDRAERR